ncbi:flagellar filament capping protein FliD [Demequina capsici]|uniref:Flagellar hook-associated protein 2 n=1 Tax=Demequina capsici TaxID=3075620 RepID=A0AA96F5N1_9MICO|nr:flagellar filament capping protein FliD [Demequina sp. OYTSA14]WNM24546.1 flagellar filament capping protein FliD [Demequina sp. OYTSA14]
MSTTGIDGIISGLDTTSIITSLMKLEAQPQTLLSNKKSDAESVLSALQSINVKVASLTSAAKSAADPASWKSYAATSSSSAVTTTAGTTATAGSLTFTVGAVATSQVSLTAAAVDGASLVAQNPPQLTFLKDDGSFVTVSPASNSLADITAAINASDAGVTATKVQVSGGSTPTYRLQFTSTATGTAGSFQLYEGDQAAVEAGTATRLDSTVTTAATDASITLYAGTAAEQTYTQSSNTFTGLMTGVDVSLSSAVAAGTSVTVTVAPNASAVQSLASSLVTNLNTILGDITSFTKSGTSTNSNGDSIITAGTLGGDSAIRNLQSALTQAASYPIDGVSPSKYGISISSDGTFAFDADKFASALASDPDGTASFVQALSARIQTTSDSFSNATTGTLTLKVNAEQSTINDLSDQIANWDIRLASRQETLQKQFTAMEAALSTLQSQGDYITQQINSLNSSN